VTHDQEEALEVADRIVVMNEGKIEQQGTPDEVYSNPASPFVYSFLGTVNMFHARPRAGQAAASGSQVVGYARPHEIDVSREDTGDGAIAVTVQRVLPLRSIVRLELVRLDNGESMEVEIPRVKHDEFRFAVGEQLFVTPNKQVVFVEDYLA
jgi:sulfate transport system ATP-binding protein